MPLISSAAEFEREPRGLYRNEIADRVERAIGDLAVEDFVTPPKARFAKGTGHVEFTRLVGCTPSRVILGVRSVASDGTRVAVCLFGSRDNLAGSVSTETCHVGGSEATSSGASISSWLVEGFPEGRAGSVDPRSISLEAVSIAFGNGAGWASRQDRGKRECTFDEVDDLEWFAEIYSDVVLDPSGWSSGGSVGRVVIGAPLWVRTPRGRGHPDSRRKLNAQPEE
ncbi:hypothetical protein [Micromonospora phaseoli]|uniref:hypothetical protein n=1 Tax=Micromonospora phaseoli TaxID=1144548 RepID=UPI00111344DC|nr:hypothetical protein [Micromonospora phaseoli]